MAEQFLSPPLALRALMTLTALMPMGGEAKLLFPASSSRNGAIHYSAI